jgi:hypothetical protein
MKTIRKGFALLFKTTLLALLIAVLTPTLYFAWRAGQPMELAEFKGLTYYQFLEWRSIAHNDLEVKYKASHPQANVKMGVCDTSNRLITFSVSVLQSWWYTYMALTLTPDEMVKFKSMQHSFAPDNTTLLTFFPSWWTTYEKFIWSLAEYTPHTSLAECRIQPNIPTPEEFEALKMEHQLSVVQ